MFDWGLFVSIFSVLLVVLVLTLTLLMLFAARVLTRRSNAQSAPDADRART